MEEQNTNSDVENNKGEEVTDKTSVIQSDTFKVRIAQAGEAPPCLVLLVGPVNEVGRQWAIETADCVIGRAPTSYIHVAERSLSKSHAKLVISSGEVSIMDLESTNRTAINNILISPLKPYKLKNNDQIKAGNIIFKFLERGNIETVSVAQTFNKAIIDSLTGIYNRGALNAQGIDVFNKSRVLGTPLSVIVFDIDHFKQVNDTYGHPTGDYVLKDLTRVVRESLIRGNDYFARYGGEEFCLLLLGSPIRQVEDIGERIRRTIQEHRFNFEGKNLPLTISVGISTIQEQDKSWSDIFNRADKALYAAKTGGRNRVSLMLK
ncbi:MAG: diguanylate cyclase [Bdellovibrionales bacterium RBG_16_40_8]|nr:MAG: diguanylate cyclase [Bdellovibrionales bacterium RBG_16_40_8]